MEYAKMTIKSDYRQRGDLVLRSYIRAMIKTLTPELLDINNDYEKLINYKGPYLCDIDKAYIYGIVDDKGVFYEIFTNNIIDYDDYQLVDAKEFNKIMSIPKGKRELLKKVIEKVLFKQENDLNIEISNTNELAVDRDVEFVAFDRCLSRINIYHRLGDNDCDDYDNFLRKLEEVKKIKYHDSMGFQKDEYEVYEYIPREEKVLKK